MINLAFGIIWILLGVLDTYMIAKKFSILKMITIILQVSLGVIYLLKV